MVKTALLIAALLATPAAAQEAAREPATDAAGVRLLYDHPIPGLPGKSLRGVLVTYGPGGASPGHRHAPSAFITATVLDGAVVSRVNDGPERVYRAGESFVEQPGDHHAVSRNASGTVPARLLAVFVVDSGETRLTMPDD
ncbi:cupin domain-containing protein [Methylobacterium sp. JK268]